MTCRPRLQARLAALLLLALASLSCFGRDQFVFPNLKGPQGRSVVPESVAAKPEDFGQGSASRLALLITTTDSSWLGIVHGLRSIGIPVRVTRDYKSALQHRVVLIYPADSPRLLPEEAAGALQEFVDHGGTLVGIAANGAPLERLFGFEGMRESRDHLKLLLAPGGQFSDPKELALQIGEPPKDGAKRALVSFLYNKPDAEVLATYEDGGAAILRKRSGEGVAIAIGLDLGRLLSVGYDNRDEYIARSYVGEYEPAIDVFLRMFKSLYAAGSPEAVTLGTVPFGKALTILLTHDIDFQRSVANAVTFARLEKQAGVAGTYFVQTKYMRDFSDLAFFNDKNLDNFREIQALGMEIGSHSVAHSHQFARFDLGTGDETYPDYAPRVINVKTTRGGTVLGELRVSKFLLDSLLGASVVSFRPGHLSNPYTLPQALAATGFLYSSSNTANNSLTHLPFRLTYGRGFEADIDVLEFPVTIEDEAIPAAQRLEPALELVRKLSTYGALCTVLIHPSRLDAEIEFERRFIAATRKRAWFSTLRDFGRFWHARDRVELDARITGADATIRIEAPEEIDGLVLEVPAFWKMLHASAAGSRSEPGRVVLGPLKGPGEVVFSTGR